MSKPSKTRKMTAGDQLVTRAELQFFANAVDARIAQAIERLREELTPATRQEPDSLLAMLDAMIDAPFMEHAARTAVTVPTDSEGAE